MRLLQAMRAMGLPGAIWLSMVGLLGADEPGKLPRELREALVPGLRVAFRSPDGQTLRDVRQDRLAALLVPAGESPSAFSPPGPFQAEFAGWLKLRLRDVYSFEFRGQGTATLEINGQTVLTAGPGDLRKVTAAPVELVKGYNAIRILYQSPAAGAAKLRVYWFNDSFPVEPLPADALLCDGTDRELQHGLSRRDGLHLLASRRCYACHQLPDGLAVAGDSPLRVPLPNLKNTGHRLQAAWLARWLVKPESIRDQTTMPALLGEATPESETARDLAAFLLTLKTDPPPAPLAESTEPLLKQGRQLFEGRGCIGCHRFTEPTAEDEANRISLHFIGAKYQSGALRDYLRDTRRLHPGSRMPLFRFSEAEATALAVYLRDHAKGSLPALPAGDASRGQKLFADLRCVQCHRLDQPVPPAQPELFQAPASKGCLAETIPAGLPDYDFAPAETRAIRDYLKAEPATLARIIPAEYSRRQVDYLKCNACHERDGREAELPFLLADEGETGMEPDVIPHLTWAGEKLQPAWSSQLLAGELDYRLREHFHTRMPAFPLRGKLIAAGLSAEHGFEPEEDLPAPEVADAAKLGEILTTKQGFDCGRCHDLADQPATAPFQARSTNLAFARGRLRYEFFRRWMLLPQRVDHQTRMLRFSPDSQTTPLAQYYEGDAAKQFDAIWHYLADLRAKEKTTRER